jgi:hypothetical protein
MTEHEIQQRVDRMLAHLDRLLLNKDMSEADYHAAVLDLSRWEDEEMTKTATKKETRHAEPT